MQVSFNDGRFFYRPVKSSMVSTFGNRWRFHRKMKSVSTTHLGEVYKHKEHFDKEVKKIFDRLSVMKTNQNVDLSWVKELVIYNKLDDSQKNGVQFAISRNHSYLAFEAGVGKTATAIIADFVLRLLNKSEPSLFIVPPKLVRNWLDEFALWTPSQKIKTIRSFEEIDSAFDSGEYHVILCADSLFVDKAFDFSLISEVLKDHKPFTTVVVDEAQRFINLSTGRTKELFVGDDSSLPNGIVHNSKNVILLSGSHMKRGPIDLFAPISALAWNLISFMSYESFGVKYCNGFLKRIGHREVWDFNGSSREDIFHKKIYNKFIYEKTLEESRPELKGKKIERVIRFDWDGNTKVDLIEKAILKKKKVADIIGSKNVGDIPKYRQMIAKSKVEITYDYIVNAIETHDGPVVLFAIYHDTIKLLLEKYKKYKPYTISGNVSDKERSRIEKLFAQGKIGLIVWQVQTAYGVNMQKGNRALFVESSWSDDDNDQAIRRFFRRGQKKRVVADHLVLANTLDDYVLKTSLDKRKTTNKVRKGKTI